MTMRSPPGPLAREVFAMRVLLVEDDAATSASIEMMLKRESFICDTTDLGEDGLEIGKLYDYDIIILDLMLPDIDGYEVLRRLRAARADRARPGDHSPLERPLRIDDPHRQAGGQYRQPPRYGRGPSAPSHRQGIRHPRTVEPAQGDDADQGDVPQSSLRRDGRAGAQDHRRLCLQAAQKARNGDRRGALHR